MPCSWAYSSASAICLAMGSASSIGTAPCWMRSASVGVVNPVERGWPMQSLGLSLETHDPYGREAPITVLAARDPGCLIYRFASV